MIQTEKIEIGGREFIRTYSDENRYVVREGVAYSEAVDPIDSGREYTEGDIMEELEEVEEVEGMEEEENV